MYELVNNKDKSLHDFIKFLDFMIENNKYMNSGKFDRDDYLYHFQKIPSYTRDILCKFRYDLIDYTAQIGIINDRLNKKIDSFTDLNGR